jgi:hypothetical protein
MKLTWILFALMALSSLALVFATDASADCHPTCRWQCDDPICPAQCHPVCERPKCQVHCEETPCAQCKVHCDKPQCNVRCPKDLCEKNDCPKCETVCAPAQCRTSCVAPNAVCTPMCEETKCDWKCKKPTLCPRPKCELVCETPKCAAKPPAVAAAANATALCPCNQANLKASLIQAGEAKGVAPSFLELMNEVKFQEQQGQAPLCACSK